jgi:hypothetical protein
MSKGTNAPLPKGAMSTETQWLSEENAQKLAQDPKNRVFRWSEGRKVNALPAETVYRIVKFWHGWVQLRVQENAFVTQPELQKLMIDEEERRVGDDRAALEKFRKDYPTFFQHLSTPNLSPKVLDGMFEMILKCAKVQANEVSITKEEMLAHLIQKNLRAPTPDEQRLIAQGKATSLDSLSFLKGTKK